MSEAKPFPHSPFKGPNPLEYGDRIYGRNREINDLYNQLCANRIVVLHSPSGAGKSSLVQAGLILRLEAQFDVWGPALLCPLHDSRRLPRRPRCLPWFRPNPVQQSVPHRLTRQQSRQGRDRKVG